MFHLIQIFCFQKYLKRSIVYFNCAESFFIGKKGLSIFYLKALLLELNPSRHIFCLENQQ